MVRLTQLRRMVLIPLLLLANLFQGFVVRPKPLLFGLSYLLLESLVYVTLWNLILHIFGLARFVPCQRSVIGAAIRLGNVIRTDRLL